MYNPQVPTDGHSSVADANFRWWHEVFGKAPEQHGNQRNSATYLSVSVCAPALIRLKVIDALLTAADSQRTLGVRGVHSHLLNLGIPLSFLSVREVSSACVQRGRDHPQCR